MALRDRIAPLLVLGALAGCQGAEVGEAPGDGGTGDGATDAPDDADAGPSPWTLIYSDPQAAPDDALHDILTLGSSDVWVVGKNQQILHHKGNSWDSLAQLPGVHLFGIWGSTGTDLTTVGAKAFDLSPVVLNYDGVSWTSGAPFPPSLPALTDVWGLDTQRYFTGLNGQIFQDDPVKFPTLRYHLAVVTGGCPDGTGPSPDLNAIDAENLDNILAVGDQAVLAHKDAKGWIRLCGPDQNVHYASVFRAPGQKIFFVGSNFLGLMMFLSRNEPLLQMYENQAIPDPDKAFIQRISGDATHVIAVGDRGTILYYDYKSDPSPLPSPTSDTLFGVAMAAPDTVYVCGRGNRVWRASLGDLVNAQ